MLMRNAFTDDSISTRSSLFLLTTIGCSSSSELALHSSGEIRRAKGSAPMGVGGLVGRGAPPGQRRKKTGGGACLPRANEPAAAYFVSICGLLWRSTSCEEKFSRHMAASSVERTAVR